MELSIKQISLDLSELDLNTNFLQPIIEANWHCIITLHRFVSEERQCDSRIHWQVICVHKVQNGPEDRSLRNASGV